ncbi:hypothetical protein ACGFZB_37640 [Streptomyces cinerochromogenes]|uniref:Uncharacterized protein n=1 Tax=Streptomyces cinerochromogenes TaxID=66422 RepID=A0ABW7BH27_9ACTN
MTTSHIAPPAPAPGTGERDPRGWVAPAIATALMVPLGLLALLFGGLSVMATDSCGPDHCSAALDTALAWIDGMMRIGGPLSGVALFTAWLLPWTRRWSAARVWFCLGALVPPLAVLYLALTLPAP